MTKMRSPLDPFAEQVLLAALGVRHQHRAAVIDDASVDFLRYAIVEATVARFHVVDGNAHSRGDDGRQPTVGVAEDQHAIRAVLCQHGADPLENLPACCGELGRLHAQVNVRRAGRRAP